MERRAKASNSKKKAGFTLIELLVVISIIALLLSILMPSLQKARESAQNAICQSNLKQLGMVVYVYTHNNRGYLPTFCLSGDWSRDNPRRNRMWFDIFNSEGVTAADGILRCPRDRFATKPSEAMPVPQGAHDRPYNDGHISYRYNMHYMSRTGLPQNSYREQRLDELRFLGKGLILADGRSQRELLETTDSGWRGFVDFGLEPSPDLFGIRHRSQSRWNGLLADFTVGSWEKDDIGQRLFRWADPR